MHIALKEAKKAELIGEVPVGCIIVGVNGKILSRGYNLTEKRIDPTAHAELIVIRKLSRRIKTWRLDGTILYTTLQPCLMCLGGIINSRISKLVYGADDPRLGSINNPYILEDIHPAFKKIEIRKGILRDDCSLILKGFFQTIRTK